MLKLVNNNHPLLRRKINTMQFSTALQTGLDMIKFATEWNMDTTQPACAGLAANQFGIDQRVCIANINGTMLIFIDPQIDERDGVQESIQESCLSFPGIRGDVDRAEELTVSWLDIEAEPQHAVFDGMNAVVLEHEIEHLDGIVCIDRMKRKTRFGAQIVKRWDVGRNEDCPCGSGKKYKRCCGGV